MFRLALYLLALAVTANAADPVDASAAKVTGQAPSGPKPFTATAYSIKGNTVKGVQTQPGIVAADPKVLPLGSTIRVSSAGEYSGLYVVTDVGTAIIGRRID